MSHRVVSINPTCSHAPQRLELNGRDELMFFVLTFLTSTWYIKNPFLRAKIVEVSDCVNEEPICLSLTDSQVLFFGSIAYRDDGVSLLGPAMNTHPMALKHLISALMHFYIG